MNNVSLKEIAEILSKNHKIMVLTHSHPDGDTLGSAFALKKAMERKGHEVKVVCPDDVPKRLLFVSDMQKSLRKERGYEPDLIVAVDVAELYLLNEYGDTSTRFIDIKIDHHGDGSEYARYNYIDGKSAAAGELIYVVIRELEKIGHAEFTPDVASLLYVAISSDTGCFKYSNVTSTTLRIAADLIDLGANNEEICYRLFELKSVNEAVAERLMYNNLNVYRSGTMAIVTYTNEMKKEYDITDDDLGNIASVLREIEGIQLAVTLRQLDDDPRSYKISMRSGSSVNASEMCKLLGGGGHARAAGAKIEADSPEDAEYKVSEAIQSVIGYV